MNIESHIPCVLCGKCYWVPELYTDYVKKNKKEFICGDCCCRKCYFFQDSELYRFYSERETYKDKLISTAKKQCLKLILNQKKK